MDLFKNIVLYDHQVVSVNEMEKREFLSQKDFNETDIKTNVGIQGDMVGYGKTLSMITLIIRDRMPFPKENGTIVKKRNICSLNTYFTTCNYISFKSINCTLIIANLSLLNQWKCEFDKLKDEYTPRLAMITRSEHLSLNVNEYDVIICSIRFYYKFIEKYPSYSFIWKRFIFDEFCSSEKTNIPPITAKFLWFVSSTYKHIINYSQRRRTFFPRDVFINDYMIEKTLVKNDDAFVKKSYSMPKPLEFRYYCLEPSVLKMMRGLIPDSVACMISADNIKEAVATLGGVIAKDNIPNLVCNKLREKIRKNINKAKIIKNEINTTNKEQKSQQIKRYYDKSKKYLEKYKLLKERIKEQLDGECIICTDTMTKKIITPCNHIFCGQCILVWMREKATCPYCKTNINPKDLTYVCEKDEEQVETNSNTESQTKIDTMLKIIKKFPESKFILFSNYNNTFNLVEETLTKHNISHSVISGTKNRRDRIVKEFESGEIKVILLNSKTNGAGINLQMATDIILYHELDKYIETQVIGRGMRVGRKGPLKIHRLLYQE